MIDAAQAAGADWVTRDGSVSAKTTKTDSQAPRPAAPCQVSLQWGMRRSPSQGKTRGAGSKALRPLTLWAGVNVDGSVIPVIPLVNIDVYAGARMVFFDDNRTTFFTTTGGAAAGAGAAPMCQPE